MIFIAIYRQWNLKSIFFYSNTAINRVCFKVSKYYFLECDVGILRVKS